MAATSSELDKFLSPFSVYVLPLMSSTFSTMLLSVLSDIAGIMDCEAMEDLKAKRGRSSSADS